MVLEDDAFAGSLAAVDAKIEETELFLARLKDLRVSIVAFMPQPKPVPEPRYFVESRSGGPGHYVTLSPDGRTSCTCQAGVVGRTCWAQKGIAEEAKFGLYRHWFNDDRGIPRHFGKVG